MYILKNRGGGENRVVVSPSYYDVRRFVQDVNTSEYILGKNIIIEGAYEYI